MPARVGAVEPEAGGIGGSGLRACHHSRRYPAALPFGGAVAGDVPHGGGGRRGEARNDTRPRGVNQPLGDSAEPVGTEDSAGPPVQ